LGCGYATGLVCMQT